MQEDKKQDGQTTTTGSGATAGTTADDNVTNGETTTTTTDNNGEGTMADTDLSEAVVTASKKPKQKATVTPQEAETDYTKGITDYLQRLADERERLKKSQDPEAEKREERRLARDRVISSVGNALSALAWMGAAKGYAPTPKTENSSGNPYEQRYKEFIERRDKNKAAYENALQKLQDRETSTRELLQKMVLTKRSADNKEARAAELHEYDKARAAALADKAQTDADNEQDVIDAKNENVKSSTARNKASADASYATAKYKNASTVYINDRKNNPNKYKSSGSKGSGGSKDYTQKTTTDAINPVTGQKYSKTTVVQRTYTGSKKGGTGSNKGKILKVFKKRK